MEPTLLRAARHVAFYTLLLTLPITAGCSALGGDHSADGLMTRNLRGEDEMTAIVSGTLRIDGDAGCILLSERPVVWPAGTELRTGDAPAILLPGGLTAEQGDTVTGAGGEIPAASIADTALRIDGDVQHALSCVSNDTPVVVLNARGDALSVTPAD